MAAKATSRAPGSGMCSVRCHLSITWASDVGSSIGCAVMMCLLSLAVGAKTTAPDGATEHEGPALATQRSLDRGSLALPLALPVGGVGVSPTAVVGVGSRDRFLAAIEGTTGSVVGHLQCAHSPGPVARADGCVGRRPLGGTARHARAPLEGTRTEAVCHLGDETGHVPVICDDLVVLGRGCRVGQPGIDQGPAASDSSDQSWLDHDRAGVVMGNGV